MVHKIKHFLTQLCIRKWNTAGIRNHLFARTEVSGKINRILYRSQLKVYSNINTIKTSAFVLNTGVYACQWKAEKAHGWFTNKHHWLFYSIHTMILNKTVKDNFTTNSILNTNIITNHKVLFTQSALLFFLYLSCKTIMNLTVLSPDEEKVWNMP